MSDKANITLLRASKGEERESLEASYAGAEVFRLRAIQLLQQKWNTTHTKQMSQQKYETPAWAEYQADCNGVLRTLEEILNEIFNVGGVKHGK